MYRLAKEIAALGERVIVTTTTHIMVPGESDAESLILSDDLNTILQQLRQRLKSQRIVAVGSRLASAEGKMKGIQPEWVDEIADRIVDARVVVEADGSAGRPFKAPADHEPVIPTAADLVVPVVGIDVIGRLCGPEAVHRPERVARIAGIAEGVPITPEIVAKVMLHPLGTAKGSPAQARVVPVINKVDDHSLLEIAREIGRRMLDEGAARVVIARAQFEPPVWEVMAKKIISGIVLAAGKSVRMGQFKLLLEVQGKSLIRHVVEHALRSRLDEVVVVVGNDSARIRAEIERYPVRIVDNPSFAEGQSTSLKAGMREIRPDADAVIVLMGDQPFVGPEIIDAIIERYREESCLIVAPEYNGQEGSPVLFHRSLFSELRAASGDKGGRDIVRSRRENVHVVKFDSALAGRDIDTWQEYQEAIAAVRSCPCERPKGAK